MDSLNSTAQHSAEESKASTAGECVDDDDDDDEYYSDNEDFYFESDHLALRGNEDYRIALRTIVILEAQRIEVGKHIERIGEVKRIALRDPDEFLRKLTSGEGLDVPGPINIQKLPKIKFEKYNVPNASNSNSNANTNSTSTSTSNIATNANTTKKTDENDFTVRGRVYDQTKPQTFNQLWTCEEQRRLEELLIEYPPEPIEMRRFAKIAKALGNRTPRQVASRLQKYFQKLHAAGLPVPGRIPRNARSYATTRKNRMHKHMTRPTTFFPSNYVPVNITEDDENHAHSLDANYYRHGCNASKFNDMEIDNMVAVDEPNETENDANSNDCSKLAAIIRRVMNDKEKDYTDETLISEHTGFKCDYCSEEPISGTRWHCVTCDPESTDFCSDCFVTQAHEDDHHSFDHVFIGYRATDYGSQHDDDNSDMDSEEEVDQHEPTNEDTNDDDSQGDISCDDSMN